MKKQMRWLLYAMNFLAFFAISMVNTQMIPFLSKLGYTVVQRGYILAANATVFKGLRSFSLRPMCC